MISPQVYYMNGGTCQKCSTFHPNMSVHTNTNTNEEAPIKSGHLAFLGLNFQVHLESLLDQYLETILPQNLWIYLTCLIGCLI